MKTKKIVSLLFILVLVLSTTATAYASEANKEKIDSSKKEVIAEFKSTGTRTATYEVTVDGLRLRSQASLSGTILGLLNSGDMVNASHSAETVIADGYEWMYVYSYNHDTWGWVAIKYLDEIG